MSDIQVESVVITPKNVSLTMKESGNNTQQFTVTILPENATNKDVMYSINNTAIGSIDSNGLFTAIGAGTGTITVTTVDGGKTDTTEITVYQKRERPDPPIITSLRQTVAEVACDDTMEFSIDNGSVWARGPSIINLQPKTEYSIICRIKAQGEYLESDPSSPSNFVTPSVTPDPTVPGPNFITLSAHDLKFDLNKNIYSMLYCAITPNNTNNQVFWYSDNNSVITVDGSGELTAVGIGFAKVYVKSVYNNTVFDVCKCSVYKTIPRPIPPVLDKATLNSIKLKETDGCEYSMDKIEWTDNPLFTELEKNTYYTFYQRTKGEGNWQPPSEASYGLTAKTLNDETPGGESESGYTWAQEVEVKNINMYSSPYTKKSDFNLTGKFYIFNLIETNHRIRLTRYKDDCGINGQAIGWANITDLKLIENVIYVGDKVIVDGDINIYSDGSGVSIHKDKQTMYITDIIDGQEYPYGVSRKPGLARQGFAKTSQVTKYKIINIDE